MIIQWKKIIKFEKLFKIQMMCVLFNEENIGQKWRSFRCSVTFNFKFNISDEFFESTWTLRNEVGC